MCMRRRATRWPIRVCRKNAPIARRKRERWRKRREAASISRKSPYLKARRRGRERGWGSGKENAREAGEGSGDGAGKSGTAGGPCRGKGKDGCRDAALPGDE